MRTYASRLTRNAKHPTLSLADIDAIMKKIFSLVFIAIIAWLLWVAGFPLPYLINNYRLDRFAKQLEKVPLPPQTKRIGPIIKKFGNLGPCSKHGDYYAEFKIASTLSYPEIKKHYSRFQMQVPEIDMAVFSMFRGLGTHGPISIKVDKIESETNKYIVYALDLDYWHNDFRCW